MSTPTSESPGPFAVWQPADAPYRTPDAPPPAPRVVRHAPLRLREALALGALIAVVDFASWRNEGVGPQFGSGGFGLASVFLAIPLALFAAARGWRRSPRLVMVTGLLVLLALRCAIAVTPSTLLAALGLASTLPLALRGRRASVPESVHTSLATVAAIPSRLSAVWASVAAAARRARVGRAQLLPVVVPLALCLAFAGVFALANPLVASGFAWALDVLASVALPPAGRVFVWGLVFGVALLALRPALSLAKDDEAAPPVGEGTETERQVARNAFVALNVLFAAYLALDLTYLWSGRPPAGMTTQTYAHQGALWLTVALVMLTGVVGVTFRGALAHDPLARATRTLAYVWMGQGLLLGLGTYRRIAIHIAHTGLSDLRIVGMLGTTLVVAGVLLVAYKLRAQRTIRWLVRRQLDAFALTFVVYALVPTHYIAAQVNVARIQAGERGPLLHLGPQASHVESVAVLVPLLDHPDARVREGVAALLGEQTWNVEWLLQDRATWRQEDLITRPVHEALVAAGPRIDAALAGADRRDAQRVLTALGNAAAEDESPAALAAIAPAVRESLRSDGAAEPMLSTERRRGWAR